MQPERRDSAKAEANLDGLKRTISELIKSNPERAVECMVQLEVVSVLTANTTAIINLSHHICKHDEEWRAHIDADKARENQLKGAKPLLFWIAKIGQAALIGFSGFVFHEISAIDDSLLLLSNKVYAMEALINKNTRLEVGQK